MSLTIKYQMRKLIRISFSILLGFVVATAVAQDFDKGTLHNKESIKRAKIKLIEAWSYPYYLGKPSDEGYLSQRFSYDKQGNIQKEEYYSKDGQLTRERMYDSLGREVEDLGYDSEEKPNSRKIYRYGVMNNLVEREEFEVSSYPEETHRKYVFKHDDKGRMIEKIFYLDDRLVSRTIPRFDQSDKVVETIDFNSDGKIMSKSKYKYDESGRFVEEISFDDKSKIISKLKCRYYTVGETKKVKEIILSSGKRTSRTVSADDSLRNYAELIIYDDKGKASLKRTQKYTYNIDGHLLKKNVYLMVLGKSSRELLLFKYTHFE